jgi:hypothetical protein
MTAPWADIRIDANLRGPRTVRKLCSPSAGPGSEVAKAQGRIRTAAWRNALDRRACPTTNQIAMALVKALVTSRPEEITAADRGIVGKALVDLFARGFDLKEARAMLRRLRNRLVDPKDREGEPGESTSEPLTPSAWGAARNKILF